MAEDLTISNIKSTEQATQSPVSPQTSAPPPTGQDVLLQVQSENGLTIQKIRLDPSDISRFVEYRPPIRRLANETPFYIEMIDSNFQPCAIQISDGTIIQALKLAPNPDSLIINSSKMVARYNTMTRWVETHWGDEPDTITLSGSTFSLMALETSRVRPGLSVVNRRETATYSMLRELIRFFRFNGSIYQDGLLYAPSDEMSDQATNQYTPTIRFLEAFPGFKGKHPREATIRERLYIRLTFDYVSFVGYFEAFDLTEDSASPYRMTYSLVFKSERTKFILG